MRRGIVVVLVLILSAISFAEMKFGYISSATIMMKYTEAVNVQKQLQEFAKSKQQEIITKENELKKLDEDIKNMSPIISKEVKEKRIQEFQVKMQTYMRYKEESQMALQQKQVEMLKPIESKITGAIQIVSEREGFDFVYDSNTGTLLYAKLKYDITDVVLKELEKK